MANTTIQIDLYEDLSPVLAFLTTTDFSSVAGNVAGYSITLESNITWTYSIVVPEACSGVYKIELQNGDGVTIALGYVYIIQDDTNTYIATNSFSEAVNEYYLYNILTNINSVIPNYTISSASIPSVSNQNISIFKGTNWNFNISGIGNDASGFYFTLKSNKNLLDSESEIQVDKTGVKYLNGLLYNTASGSLTYSSGNSGTINVSIEPEATSIIDAGIKYFWDLKGINESSVRAFGFISIREDITNEY